MDGVDALQKPKLSCFPTTASLEFAAVRGLERGNNSHVYFFVRILIKTYEREV